MEILDFREPFSAWSHCAGVVLALPGTLLLWRGSVGDRGKQLSLLVYGLSLIFCHLASTLYHGVRLPTARILAFARLDGIGIFALIAGSYTPMAWCLMRDTWRRWTLAVVWTIVATATVLIAAGRHFSPYFLHLCLPGDGAGARRSATPKSLDSCRTASWCPSSSVACPIASRMLNLMHWPALWPRIFGPHGLFHLFVLAGSLAHYGFISRWSCRSSGGHELSVSYVYVLNNLNRCMGLQDAYPFVLPMPVLNKLRFVHEVIRGPEGSAPRPYTNGIAHARSRKAPPPRPVPHGVLDA